MSSPYRPAQPFQALPALAVYPYHFTRAEAAEKQGLMVQTHIAIFDIPKGTCGTVVHAAMTDDGYSVAVAWHVTPDRPHDSHVDTDLAPSSDTILDWFTKNEYERYLTEL